MEEIWKPVTVDGEIYENYEVSNMGRVRSLNYRHTDKVQVLKPCVSTRGYLLVCLSKNGKRKMCLVHRLVAFAFIEIEIENDDTENKTEVNHIDENKTNNRVENLEWCNREQNNNHGTRTERTSKKVRCVETGEVFESIHEVERKLGLSKGNICECCNGKGNRKTCGGFHWEYVD